MDKRTKGKIEFNDLRKTLGVETVYGKDVTHDFSRHTHRTLCIGIVEEGVRILLCRGKRSELRAGQVFLIPPHEAHACGSGGEPHTYKLLLVLPTVVSMILPEGNEVNCTQLKFQDLVLNEEYIFNQLLDLHAELASSETMFFKQTLVLSVLGNIIEKSSNTENCARVNPAQCESIKAARNYIDEHFSETLHLENIAQIACLSPYHFIRVFSKAIGVPPHIYQQQVRIRHAKGMLGKGIPIADVASATGFTDQSHFSNTFKKFMGITPGEYIGSARC